MAGDIKDWLRVLLSIVALGGIGGMGLEYRSAERYDDNADYVDQVSIELLELELKIAGLRERLARLEGTHEKH